MFEECSLEELSSPNNSAYFHISYEKKLSPLQEQTVFLKDLHKEQNTNSLLLTRTLKLQRDLKEPRLSEGSMKYFSNYSSYCSSFLALSSKWIGDPGNLFFPPEATSSFFKPSFILKEGNITQ